MKKNKAMRFASFLLVLTLLSTSAISGTFAKYTTSATASDTARVAKWGVQVATDTNLFDQNYATNSGTDGLGFTGTYSASADEDIVAPGTSGAMTFSITGTPEVAVKVAVSLGETTELSMITLPAGNYTDYTTSPATADGLVLNENYYPIVWTLKRSNTEISDWNGISAVETGNLQKIQDYLTAATLSTTYSPNTKLDNTFGYYQLSWTWAYSGNDKADTYLGNVAATTPDDIVKTGVITNEAFKLSISVTQCD